MEEREDREGARKRRRKKRDDWMDGWREALDCLRGVGGKYVEIMQGEWISL